MALQKKFAAFAAVPLALAAIGGAAAFTAQQNSNVVGAALIEDAEYLYSVTGTTASPQATYSDVSAGTTVKTKNQHHYVYANVTSGEQAVASPVAEAGDLIYISSFSNDYDAAGNVVRALRIDVNAINIPEMNANYAAYTLPIKVYKTTDLGETYTDVTSTYFETAGYQAWFWNVLTDPSFELYIDGEPDANFLIEVAVGGTIIPQDGTSGATSPMFTFSSTPVSV